jgi:MAPEG family protein
MTLEPEELRAEQRKVIWRAVGALVFCVLLLGIGYVMLPRYYSFPRDLPERLAFAMRADVFVLVWVLLGVRMVSKGRFLSPADIAGSAFTPPSPRLAVRVAFLQNTLEQAVVAVGCHVALATLVSGPELSLIVTAVVLFGIGRVAFLLGYPQGAGGRAFGMVTTSLPTFAGYLWAVLLMVLPS